MITPETKSSEVLSFDHVNAVPQGADSSGIEGLSFSLCDNQMMSIDFDAPNIHLPIADLANGLLNPSEGTVTYRGRPWSAIGAFVQCKIRSGIRRNYLDNGWVSNLTVMDNILLSSRHHNQRDNDLLQQAEQLSELFEIPTIPKQLPALCAPHILRRCDWVRLFVGKPEVLILDRPLAAERSSAVANAFADQLTGYLNQGGCCIWMDQFPVPEKLQVTKRLCYSQGSFKEESS